MTNSYKSTLKTKRLILRLPTLDDFEACHSWCSNPDNVRYMSFGPNSEEQTRAWLENVKAGRDFAVIQKESGVVIGCCGIYPEENGFKSEVGWILHMDYWRQGYGTELAHELVRYGFEDLKLGRIQAPCVAENHGSYRVMERIGMRREGLTRKTFWERVEKKWVDDVRYAILAEEYFAERSPLVGKTANAKATVSENNTAKAVGSGSLDVFATPMMVALMEEAASKCLADYLASGQTSVGTQINVEHTAASPLGSEITAIATVEFVAGKKIEFVVTANDSSNEIGKGRHTRYIVDKERFMAKVGNKR